jgi:hypothetical protein
VGSGRSAWGVVGGFRRMAAFMTKALFLLRLLT